MLIKKATDGRHSQRRRGTRRAALKDQRGSMLIEAVVASAMLMVLSMGFLASIDAAGKSSGNLRSRTVAASLARDDMERLRALKLSDLVNLNASRTQVVNGVTFTISSTTRWVDDVTGDATCSSGSTKSDYLKAVSTVTFPFMGTTKPIVNESLVAVPNGSFNGSTGSLIAKVTNRDGGPVPGIGVSITGPSVLSGTTDAGGCALWSAAAVGGYYVDISQPGYVDRSGTQAVRKSATISSGATNSLAFEYDRAATANVSFDTQVGATVQAAKWTGISYAHSGMPQGSASVTTGTAAASLSTGAKLFPFPDPYAIWGGSCAGSDPRTYGAAAQLVAFNAGEVKPVTVRLPALNIIVKKDGAVLSTARVRITPATPGCGTTFTALLNTNTTGPLAGTLKDPGLPYGDYDVCVDDNQSNSNQSRRASTSTPIQNRTAGGTATMTLNILSTTSKAPCA